MAIFVGGTEKSFGKLLQVQHNTTSGSNTSVTSDSFTATEVTDQITPSASSSKILVICNLSCSHKINEKFISDIPKILTSSTL